MNDLEKIEHIVRVFTRSLFKYRMEELKSYMHLAEKIAQTVQAEIMLQSMSGKRYVEVIKPGFHPEQN